MNSVGGVGIDGEVAKNFQRTLQKQGLKFKMGTKVIGADKQADGSYKVNMENVKSGKTEQLDADVIMVCVGRRPYTETLGLETCGIELNERGQVPVDDNFMVCFTILEHNTGVWLICCCIKLAETFRPKPRFIGANHDM